MEVQLCIPLLPPKQLLLFPQLLFYNTVVNHVAQIFALYFNAILIRQDFRLLDPPSVQFRSDNQGSAVIVFFFGGGEVFLIFVENLKCIIPYRDPQMSGDVCYSKVISCDILKVFCRMRSHFLRTSEWCSFPQSVNKNIIVLRIVKTYI